MNVGRLIRAAANGNALAIAVSEEILACNSCGNVYTASDLNNGDYELYDGTGTLYSCRIRVCPSCLPGFSRRNRKCLRLAIEKRQRRRGEIPYFITLTAPTQPAQQVSLLMDLKVFQRAWRLFRKRRWTQAVM